MSHATVEEIHDHAYGFRLSEHVAACDDCGRACERVAAERETLRDVLSEEETPEIPRALLEGPAPLPAPRRRIGSAALAAAAVLLAALVWALWQPSADRTPATPPLPSQEAEIDRLLGELRSSSPVRKKIAALALMRYGGSAYDAYEYFHTHPELPALRGQTDEDRALLARLKKTRISLKVEKSLYTDVVPMLQEHVGKLRLEIRDGNFETAFLSLNLENATVYEAVEAVSAQLKVPFSIRYGSVLIGKQPEEWELAPLRIAARPGEVARRIAQLSSDSPDQRDEATQAIRLLGFGAEPALWGALDAPSLETRSRAEALLLEFYGGAQAAGGRDKRPIVSVDLSDVVVEDVMTEILRQVGASLPVIWDSRTNVPFESISFKVQSVPFDSALRLLLDRRGIECIVGPDSVLITSRGHNALRTSRSGVLWLKPALAREAETLIADLASGDPQRVEKMMRRLREPEGLETETVLDALDAASGVLEGDSLRRCQRLRRTIAAGGWSWYPDLPSGAELQALTPVQRALLDARVALPATDALTIEQLLKRDGVRAEFRADGQTPLSPIIPAYRGMGKEPTRGALLRLALRNEGLDFYLNGETIVIDTTEKVREAVEK
jgi:hypothetical protein